MKNQFTERIQEIKLKIKKFMDNLNYFTLMKNLKKIK